MRNIDQLLQSLRTGFMGATMFFVFLWVVLAIFVAVGAANRGRNAFGWFVLAVLLSPLLAGFILLMMGRVPKASVAAVPNSYTHVRCPACAEFVQPTATVCRYCGGVLTPNLEHLEKLKRRKEMDAKGNRIALAVTAAVAVLMVVAVMGGLRF